MQNGQYDHGGDIYGRGITLDYSICVNPLGMPEAAASAASEALASIGQYPDPHARELVHVLHRYLSGTFREGLRENGVPEAWILPGNGAAELIYALTGALRPAEVWAPVPGFSEYRRAAAGAGSRIREIPRVPGDGFQTPPALPEQICREYPLGEEGILFLTNPDHPTGRLSTRAELLQLADVCEETWSKSEGGLWLCVDECFLPFLQDEAERTLIPCLARYPHLVILRAFTKICGMAGLRLGYLLCANPTLHEQVRAVLQPWNLSVVAQAAGAAALKESAAYEAYLRKTRALIRAEREYLQEEMQRHDLACWICPGDGNYIFFRARPDLKEQLLERGILIRSFAEEETHGSGYFRIGIRTREENRRLVEVWKQLAAVPRHGD